MLHDSCKYLYDMRQAVELLREFTRGKSFADYAQDSMLRSAVERQLEVVGQGLYQMAQFDLDTVNRISAHEEVLAFWNILNHRDVNVDDRLAWGLIETRLDSLSHEVHRLLQ